ncbi:MAG: glycosyltransferase family A protein [bacterium]
MKKPAPIILFTYNRPFHTRRVVESLVKNRLAEQSDLIIYSDGPADSSISTQVEEVRAYLRTISGFRGINIIERENNLGLADSVITGVTEVFDNNDRVIVIEDDLILSKYFLYFMNTTLDQYEEVKIAYSVAGYSYPIRIPRNYDYDIYPFYRCSSSGGWATWKNRWETVDWDVRDYEELKNNRTKIDLFNRGGEDLFNMLTLQINGDVDSWAIRWCYSHFKNNALCLYPTKAHARNAGFDGTGVHSHVTNKFDVDLQNTFTGEIRFCSPEEVNVEIARRILKFLRTRDAFFKIRSPRFLWENILRQYFLFKEKE